MRKLEIAVLSILFIALIWCFVMLYRNEKVGKVRLWFIHNEFDYYDLLPSYQYMLYSFKPLSKEYWVGYVVFKAKENREAAEKQAK